MEQNNTIDTKKGLKTWQKVTIAVVVVVLVLTSTGLGVYFGIFYGKGAGIPVQSNEIEGFVRTKSYIGTRMYENNQVKNQIDLKKIFSHSDYQSATFSLVSGQDIAKISDNIITLGDNTGEIVIKASFGAKTEDYTYTVVDGINVFNFDDMELAIAQKLPVVLQANIDVTHPSQWKNASDDMKLYETLLMYKSLYGNAYQIDGTQFSTDQTLDPWDALFTVKGKDVQFINVHIIGFRVEKPEGETVVLDDYADGGIIIKFEGESKEDYPSGSIIDCVLEKAHKIIMIHAADVYMQGNIIREAGDTCISVQTSNVRTSNITLKNNILISPQIAGIVFWMWEKQAMLEENYVTLNIEGVLDIYNWKNETTAALMPVTEGFAGVINPIIQSTLAGSEFDDQLIMQGGHKWIHVGIVVISTGKSKNLPKINGIDNLNFDKRQFPLPGAVKPIVGMILKTTDMYGYTTTKNLPPTAPTSVTSAMFEKIKG